MRNGHLTILIFLMMRRWHIPMESTSGALPTHQEKFQTFKVFSTLFGKR